MKKANFTKLLSLGFAWMLAFSLTPTVSNAQCPAGEAQVSMAFGLPLFGTGFPNEISWELVNTTTCAGEVIVDQITLGNFGSVAGTTVTQCVPDGVYEFRAHDSFGDGWNGNTVTITLDEDNSVNGCVTPANPPGTTLLGTVSPPGSNATYNLGLVGCVSQCAFTAVPPAALDAGSNDQGICGAFVNLDAMIAVNADCTNGYTNDYNGTGSASDVYPVGTTTVTIQSLDINCIPTDTYTFTVTVNDTEPPVIVCPPDLVINAGPGECSAILDYVVTATDNCEIANAGEVNHPIDFNNGQAGIMFDAVNLTGLPLDLTSFTPSLDGGTWNMEVYYTTTATTWVGNQTNAGAWTLAGSVSVTSGGANPGTLVDVGSAITIPGGSSKGIYVTSTAGFPMNYTGIGAGTQRAFDDGILQVASTPGAGKGYPFAATFISRSYNGGVQYEQNLVTTIVQTQGVPSGSTVFIGQTYTNCFTATDPFGNTADCCFDVEVNEFPNAINYLVCNDNVQVTLDENCVAEVTADMVLEGGPYGCYDEYIVTIRTATGLIISQSDGQVGGVGAVLGNNNYGKTYTVEVSDPDNGNIKCWGTLTVEDKIAPILVCSDLTIACTEDLPNEPKPEVSGPIEMSVDPNEPIGEPGAPVPDVHEYTFDYSIFAGGVVEDVDVIVNLIDHDWLPDLNISVTSPGGSPVRVFGVTGCFGAEFDIDATFDDEGAGGLTLCVELDAGGAPLQCLQLPGVQNPTLLADGFDGEDAGGDWVLSFSDGAGGNDGIIVRAGLIVTSTAAQVIPYDACDGAWDPNDPDNPNNITVTYEEAFADGNCGGPSGVVTRAWTATDFSGNSSTCQQTITIARPTLDDVQLPGDVMFTCNQYKYWPNVIEPEHLHHYISDTDLATDIINVNLDPLSDDNDLPWPQDPNFCFPHGEDNPDINSTNTANGGGGSPGNTCGLTPNNGLDDADVLELTGAGRPEVAHRPIFNGDLCGISIDYEDIWIDECEGTFKILRTWTLIDWCANPVAVLEHNQVVKVVDVEGPQVSAPPTQPNQPLTIDVFESDTPTTGPHSVCTGHVVVPPATSAGDVCSDVAGWYTELYSLGATSTPANPVTGALIASNPSNGGIFWSVPLLENGADANYVVRYVAYDECDNETEALVQIRVHDRVPPVAVCDEITEVAVTNNGAVGDGCSTLHAEDLDDGSYDNCKPVYYLMAKMDDSFSQDIFNRCYYPTRDFCCEEVGEDVQVILLVLDGDPSQFFTTFEAATLGCDGTPGLFLTSGFTALNYNSCMVTVEVSDKLAPIVVSCPGPRDITCDYYWDVLEVPLALCADSDDVEACEDGVLYDNGFGTVDFYDNCALNITPNVNINIDQCGNGTITRTWQAVDDAGNGPATCTQQIRVHHVSDWAVEFPADLTENCGNSAPDFGEPELAHETCELLAVSYEDTYYDVVPDACYKIVRDWTVINWCVVGDDIDQEVTEISEFDLQFIIGFPACDLDGDGDCDQRTFRDSWDGQFFPDAADALTGLNLPPDTDLDNDPWDGYIVYQQTIKVSDAVAPEFNEGCAIDEVCIEDNTCTAEVEIPTPSIEDCSPDVAITYTHDMGDLSEVPPGTYTVTYTAMDNCGNSNACETEVVVSDCKKPTPYCKNGLVIELMQSGTVEVWAVDFDAGSFDNCPGALKISFNEAGDQDGIEFNCDHVGQQNVQIWVEDAAGNKDFCNTFVIIEDNMGACPGDDPLVAGTIATEGNETTAQVDVTINSPSGFNSTETTGNNGVYDFGPNGVPAGGDYTITPVKDINPLNGVSTFDLVLISKHILGVQSLDSPYKMIAADANNSESVTTFDLVTLRKLILFIDDDFTNNTSWRFVRADHVFADPTNPWATDFAEVYNLNNLNNNMTAADFVSVKTGDVNGNANPLELTGSEDRNFTGNLTFAAQDAVLTAGQTHTIEFTANDFNVTGYQFTLNFDNSALELVEVVSGLAQAENFGLTLVEEGAITTSWNSNEAKVLSSDETVFSIVVTAKSDVTLSDVISISSRYTTAEAYNGTGELKDVVLEFNGTAAAAQFELMQNTPNPFADATVIGFTLPSAETATITISDVSGKVIRVIEGDFAKGYNQVTVKRDELSAAGVLYYQLDTATDSATKKMILID